MYKELSHIFANQDQAETQEDRWQHMRPSTDEFKSFCEQLHRSEDQEVKPKKSAILSVIEGHSLRYMPKTVQLDLPPPLTNLYSSTRLELDLPTLLEEGAKVFEELHLTTEQFSTEATRWGLQKEDTAREAYLMVMQDLHADLQVAASGLIINPELPWIGASPDGAVTCACHGPGILEIKCPFSAKDRTLRECVKDSRFCLTDTEEVGMTHKVDHSYMYQVQAQMCVAEVKYCGFVVWTPQELFT
ncbi:hypothetical protein ABVT39_008939 [Epinephelus coioides]